jgi:predicted AlkP superfamily phosphohydrolase/phosphomutase
MVDKRIGRLVDLFGEDCTTFVLSDHGSKSMSGAFCVNQWLENEGYLAYKIPPKTIVDFDKAEIDWQKTKAWGWGGYYARIFFNVKGREPSGIVDPKNLEAEKKILMDKVMTIPDDKGTRLKNMVLFPEQIYGVATGDKPDLMVYFGDLDWRSAGTIGHDSLYLFENDTGPDDSVHSMNGIFMMYNPRKEIKGRQLMGAKIADMAPTLLQMFGISIEKGGFDGRALEEVVDLARK